ncbi:MAG TPA: hypothetical protein VM425_16875 [Myxococcota bacterium]|nr:hypothetical protein [Myxococcota bacterium]
MSILEVVASLLMIGFALTFLLPFVKVMSTSSLWNDELYSIMHFSSRGVIRTLTDYHVPNNHIFFNLLNALTPGSASFNPLRARIWSFIFVAASMLIGTIAFARRGRFFEGSLFFLVMAVNQSLLDLTLQARGYGLLCFCVVTTSLLVLSYLHNSGNLSLVLISLLTILGTWTIPTYIFFSGTLMLILFFQDRKPKLLVAGIITLLVVIALYAPVWSDLYNQTSTYSDNWGYQYGSWGAVCKTIRKYFLSPFFGIAFAADWNVYFFLLGVVTFPVIIWKPRDSTVQGVRILLIAVFVFLAICRIMKTPAIRTTSFVVLPLAICLLIRFGNILRSSRVAILRPLVFIIAATFFSLHSFNRARHFRFKPIENWMGVARFIERTFPKGTEISASFRNYYLRVYLDPAYMITKKFEQKKFAAGRQVCVDGDFFAKERFDPTEFSPSGIEIRIPQRRGEFQKVCLSPPQDSGIEQILDGNGRELGREMYDRNLSTRWTTNMPQSKLQITVGLRVFLKPGVRYHSLNIVALDGDIPLKLETRLSVEGRSKMLVNHYIERYGDFMTIFLGDQEIEYVDLKVLSAQTNRFFSVNEMWAYPERTAQQIMHKVPIVTSVINNTATR